VGGRKEIGGNHGKTNGKTTGPKRVSEWGRQNQRNCEWGLFPTGTELEKRKLGKVERSRKRRERKRGSRRFKKKRKEKRRTLRLSTTRIVSGES